MEIGTLIALAVLACLAMLTTGDGGEGDDHNDDDNGGGPQLPPEAQKLLDAERARLRKKNESDLAAERERIRAELKAEADAEAAKAKMDEIDRIKLEQVEATQAREAAEARAAAAEAQAVRAEFIAEHAANLPPAYRRMITGATAEELQTSLEAAQAEYDRDFEERTGQKPVGRQTDPNGKPPNGGGGDLYTREQLAALTADEQAANAEKVTRSLAAL